MSLSVFSNEKISDDGPLSRAEEKSFFWWALEKAKDESLSASAARYDNTRLRAVQQYLVKPSDDSRVFYFDYYCDLADKDPECWTRLSPHQKNEYVRQKRLTAIQALLRGFIETKNRNDSTGGVPNNSLRQSLFDLLCGHSARRAAGFYKVIEFLYTRICFDQADVNPAQPNFLQQSLATFVEQLAARNPEKAAFQDLNYCIQKRLFWFCEIQLAYIVVYFENFKEAVGKLDTLRTEAVRVEEPAQAEQLSQAFKTVEMRQYLKSIFRRIIASVSASQVEPAKEDASSLMPQSTSALGSSAVENSWWVSHIPAQALAVRQGECLGSQLEKCFNKLSGDARIEVYFIENARLRLQQPAQDWLTIQLGSFQAASLWEEKILEDFLVKSDNSIKKLQELIESGKHEGSTLLQRAQEYFRDLQQEWHRSLQDYDGFNTIKEPLDALQEPSDFLSSYRVIQTISESVLQQYYGELQVLVQVCLLCLSNVRSDHTMGTLPCLNFALKELQEMRTLMQHQALTFIPDLLPPAFVEHFLETFLNWYKKNPELIELYCENRHYALEKIIQNIRPSLTHASLARALMDNFKELFLALMAKTGPLKLTFYPSALQPEPFLARPYALNPAILRTVFIQVLMMHPNVVAQSLASFDVSQWLWWNKWLNEGSIPVSLNHSSLHKMWPRVLEALTPLPRLLFFHFRKEEQAFWLENPAILGLLKAAFLTPAARAELAKSPVELLPTAFLCNFRENELNEVVEYWLIWEHYHHRRAEALTELVTSPAVFFTLKEPIRIGLLNQKVLPLPVLHDPEFVFCYLDNPLPDVQKPFEAQTINWIKVMEFFLSRETSLSFDYAYLIDTAPVPILMKMAQKLGQKLVQPSQKNLLLSCYGRLLECAQFDWGAHLAALPAPSLLWVLENSVCDKLAGKLTFNLGWLSPEALAGPIWSAGLKLFSPASLGSHAANILQTFHQKIPFEFYQILQHHAGLEDEWSKHFSTVPADWVLGFSSSLAQRFWKHWPLYSALAYWLKHFDHLHQEHLLHRCGLKPHFMFAIHACTHEAKQLVEQLKAHITLEQNNRLDPTEKAIHLLNLLYAIDPKEAVLYYCAARLPCCPDRTTSLQVSMKRPVWQSSAWNWAPYSSKNLWCSDVLLWPRLVHSVGQLLKAIQCMVTSPFEWRAIGQYCMAGLLGILQAVYACLRALYFSFFPIPTFEWRDDFVQDKVAQYMPDQISTDAHVWFKGLQELQQDLSQCAETGVHFRFKPVSP